MKLSFLCLLFVICFAGCVPAQDVPSQISERELLHKSPQWATIAAHLPDPATASPQTLELQADILRARRFPEDAMDYYKYALARGGSEVPLFNKLGMTELEMRNIEMARSYFHRVVKMDRKDASAWNNLGAVEYLDGSTWNAVSDYKRAVKLNKHEAVFHANLATAYFTVRRYGRARGEIEKALKLNPQIFSDDSNGGGITAHVLSTQDRARFSFEMAKMYARSGMEEQMLHSLAMASEAGMDVLSEMRKDAFLAKYEKDPRVAVIAHNAEALRMRRVVDAASARSLPELPQSKPSPE